MRFLRLLLLALFAYAANAAAQNDAAADLAGFLPGVRYVYSYRSSSDVYQDVSLIATGQVSTASHACTHLIRTLTMANRNYYLVSFLSNSYSCLNNKFHHHTRDCSSYSKSSRKSYSHVLVIIIFLCVYWKNLDSVQ